MYSKHGMMGGWHALKPLLGCWLVMASLAAMAEADDVPPPASWTELKAQRDAAEKESDALLGAGKTEEALSLAEKFIEANRRLIDFKATDVSQTKLQQTYRKDICDALGWIVRQKRSRRDWSTAVKRQQELAAYCEASYGKSDNRTIDAQNDLAYLSRCAALPLDEAGQLAKVDEGVTTFWDLYNRGKYAEALALAQEAVQVRQRLLGDASPYYADSLNRQASVYHSQGDYARAEPLYVKAIAIRKKALGEAHPDYIQSLNDLGFLYDAKGDYARAEPLFVKALDIGKKVLGENHPCYTRSLNGLAWVYRSLGDYARAEPLFIESLATIKKIEGETNADYARGLNDLAGLYKARGEYVRAESLFTQVLKIREKVLGESHPDYARSLNNLALLYRIEGQDARAEPLYLKALEIKKKIQGEDNLDYVRCLGNLAWLYKTRGDYARAEPLFRRTLEIEKKVLGENHPDYAESLNKLALLCQEQGDYAQAESLFVKAFEIRKKVLGENHPDYAQSLHNLAVLCENKGDYPRSEALFRQAIEIKKKTLGENHPDYAQSLNNLGLLYSIEGDFARAEPLCRQAVEINKTVFGENHAEYALSLDNLASLYRSQGDYMRAETLDRKVLEIRKKALGESHPDYARSLHTLASLYESRGDYARAETLHLQALAIRKKALGENHRDYAESLKSLGSLYESQGDYARAEPLLRNAVEITKQALGENNLHYASSLNDLALVYISLRDVRAEPLLRKALEITKQVLGENNPDYVRSLFNLAAVQRDDARAELLLRAVLIQQRQLEATAVVQSERQQLAMLQLVRRVLDCYLTDTAGQDQSSAPAYQQVLAWKGMVFRRQRLARAGEQTPELKALFQKLQNVAGQLAQQAWATPDPKQSAHWRANIDWLSAEKERLEAEISSRSAAYRQAQRQVTLEELRQALPKDAVLVDFLEYRDYLTPPDKKAETKASSRQRLVAFVVRHDGPAVRIDLGPAKPLSEAIDAWRASFGTSPQAAAAGKLLRERIWVPIEAQIQDARIVLLSPDGALSRLPLAALPGKTPDTFLLEERAIAIVPVAQMIPEIMQAKGSQSLPGNLLLVGNINYDAQPGSAQVAQARALASSRSLPAGAMHFQPLLGTRDEVAAIERLYQHELGTKGMHSLQETQATKAAVLAEAGKYRYLHMATHGFFIEEKMPMPPALAQRGAEFFGESPGGPGAAAMHPGLLSGLALAGANRAADAGGLADNQGVVTAEEIASQNLEGVELVMLSACETGLGKSSAGEGLLGLQRAFQAAGARSVVASLWSVPDAETRTLMEIFYTNLWQRHLSPLESLRQAQLTMLHGTAKAGEERGFHRIDSQLGTSSGKRSPYYWAAFVLSGDWR